MQFQPLSCIIKVPGKASALELEIQATFKTIKPKGKLYFRISYSYQSSAFWSTGNRMIDGNGIFLFWNREFLANIQSILLIWRSGNFFDAKNTISRPSKERKSYSSKFNRYKCYEEHLPKNPLFWSSAMYPIIFLFLGVFCNPL